MKKVAILMGSKSDADVVKKAYDTVVSFGVTCDVRVLSAHRTPEESVDLAKNARHNGYGVLICAAGKAAHLAGVVAGHTTLPVIGIPMVSSTLDGLDSLLSVVQMPSGVPVASVAIGGAENAGLLAIQILSVSDDRLAEKLADHKEKMRKATLEADKQVAEMFKK